MFNDVRLRERHDGAAPTNMTPEQPPESARWRIWLGLGLVLIIGLFAVMQLAMRQVKATRHLRPVTKTIAEKDWYTPPYVGFKTDPKRGVWHSRLEIPSSAMGLARFRFDLQPDGVPYEMNLAVVKTRPPGAVHLAVAAGDRFIGTLRPQPRRPMRNEVSATARLRLPADLTAPQTVLAHNLGPGWYGKLLLVPHPSRQGPLLAGLAGLGLLLLLVTTGWGRRLGLVGVPLVVFGVFLCVFNYTLFTKKIAPMNGVIMSDSDQLVRVLIKRTWTEDTIKHILFAPAMNWALGQTGENARVPNLRNCARVFSIVAALNCMLAYLLFLRHTRRRTSATLLTCVYGFAFSIWAYSSVYETYIFSSLILNLFLLAVLYLHSNSRLLAYLPATALLVLCGLAHIPLLVFIGVLWMRLWWSDRTIAQRMTGCLLLASLAAIGFLDGRILIKLYYAGILDELDLSWQAEFMTATQTTISEFAGTDNLTFRNLGTLLLGQFVFSHGGLPQGHLWDLGWRSAAPLLRRPVGMLLCLTCAALWIRAAIGVVRSPRMRRPAMVFAILVVAPYLGFLLYFNPKEMLLYSAPLVSVYLLALFSAGESVPGRRIDILLLVLAICQVLWNVPVLLSYQ